MYKSSCGRRTARPDERSTLAAPNTTAKVVVVEWTDRSEKDLLTFREPEPTASPISFAFSPLNSSCTYRTVYYPTLHYTRI